MNQHLEQTTFLGSSKEKMGHNVDNTYHAILETKRVDAEFADREWKLQSLHQLRLRLETILRRETTSVDYFVRPIYERLFYLFVMPSHTNSTSALFPLVLFTFLS